MKFKDYITEQDELDILQGKMGAANKKLAMYKKKIEQAGWKVIEVYQGELESDPGFELQGGYSIQIAAPNHWVLTQEIDDSFLDKAHGPPNQIISKLKGMAKDYQSSMKKNLKSFQNKNKKALYARR